MMIIRPATPSDFPEIAAIQSASWKDAYLSDLPAAYLAEAIDRDLQRHWRAVEIQEHDLLLVAAEEALVGFVAVWCRPDPFIDNLHVRPSHRSRKIGSSLLAAAAARLIANGYRTAYLWLFESNTKALRL